METHVSGKTGEKRDVVVYANDEEYASFPSLVRTDDELVLIFTAQNLEKLRASGGHPHFHDPSIAMPLWVTSRDGGMN